MNMDAMKPFAINFDLKNGLSQQKNSTKRYLANMKGIYSETAAYEATVRDDNPLVYEFYELELPKTAGDLLFGTSITYPGKVGAEYFMTKGHFHAILDTAEVYYCLNGRGYILMEDPEGNWDVQELTPGKAVYVPKRFAHRSVNIGSDPFITFFTFRADGGHDYGTIETKGFRKLIVERNGEPIIIDNPKYR